jgi:hypothetical protein
VGVPADSVAVVQEDSVALVAAAAALPVEAAQVVVAGEEADSRPNTPAAFAFGGIPLPQARSICLFAANAPSTITESRL